MPEPARPNTPAPSTQSFIAPSSTVKSGPSIKDLINDPTPPAAAPPAPAVTENTVPTQQPMPVDAPAQPQAPTPAETTLAAPSPTEAVTEIVLEAADPEPSPAPAPTAIEPVDNDPIDDSGLSTASAEVTEAKVTAVPSEPVVARPPADPDEDPEAFQTFWETMADAIFADIPTLHEPIKHYHPVRKENILIIPVKNDIQENAFAPRKHQVLRYLRDNWDETLDDIEVKLDINMETKKFILDDNDKLNALREQNPDIADFIKSLNLRIKN